MGGVEQIFRWMHILAGIIWIGLLYFFNWVNSAFAPTMDGDTKKKVVPELMPRTLYWFRWGAAWTWVTGVILLTIVFYRGGAQLLWEGPGIGWSLGAVVMLAVVFLGVFLYDALFKSPAGKNIKVGATIGFILIGVVLFLMDRWAHFGYRGYVIHTGAMFGTIMAFNVWFRIWPAQQKIIRATKKGEKPDPALVALAGARSRHNTYLSVPLFWAMINEHTAKFFSGENWGIPGRWAWVWMLLAILLGWHIVWQCYRKAKKVKGF